MLGRTERESEANVIDENARSGGRKKEKGTLCDTIQMRGLQPCSFLLEEGKYDSRQPYLLLEHLEGHAVAHQKVLLTGGLFSPDPIRLAVLSRGRNYLALCSVLWGQIYIRERAGAIKASLSPPARDTVPAKGERESLLWLRGAQGSG